MAYEFKVGIVTGCLTLAIRKDPDFGSGVVGNIAALSEVHIDDSLSTDMFYKVTTEYGVEGFANKTFVTVKE